MAERQRNEYLDGITEGKEQACMNMCYVAIMWSCTRE